MIKTVGRIIKSKDIKLEGRFLLDVANLGSDLPMPQAAASTTPQVRVLESHPQYAVIEVTCSCGRKMSLKCDYAGAIAQDPEDPQT
jgi:hypothetical protein